MDPSGEEINHFAEKIEEEEPEKRLRFPRWSPSGNPIKDFCYFVGPGWLVCVAYVDPGNYQADINSGATTRYSTLWAIWWTSLLSIYVQVLCVRLSYYAQVTLAEAQAASCTRRMRYLNWFIAEFSVLITDIPEVIGIGIALNVFFGWPYYVGVLLSLVTTMLFLATMNFGIQILEIIILFFVGVMSIALWFEMGAVGADTGALVKGWVIGFMDTKNNHIFTIITIIGSVVMPHNLYLHSASCMSRPVKREASVIKQAVRLSSWEPVLPIIVSFFVNMAIVSIAAESVYGKDNAENVGITDFCNYFVGLATGGCLLWGIALLSAGQSSAVTTTYTGQYVMDGFLNLRIPTWQRAIFSRLAVITPCVILAAAFPDGDVLNRMVNYVNALLGFLLPFAFTPLVKFNCSEDFLGEFASKHLEKCVLYTFAFLVWLVNALALSLPNGGFLGFSWALDFSSKKVFYIFLQIAIQSFTIWWQVNCIITPVPSPMMPLGEERVYREGEFAIYGIEKVVCTDSTDSTDIAMLPPVS